MGQLQNHLDPKSDPRSSFMGDQIQDLSLRGEKGTFQIYSSSSNVNTP